MFSDGYVLVGAVYSELHERRCIGIEKRRCRSPDAVRIIDHDILQARRVVTNPAVDAGHVQLDGGRELATDVILWVTGPASQPLGARSRLPVDARGFVEIEDSFQVRGWPDLFAVGDCASLPGMAKAGVYAVRAAPLLDHNLRARLEGRSLRRYQPQSDFLSLLNLGDGSALGVKWGLVVRGRLVMRLKDRIDRAFVARYR